jgi:hypothetical protein
MLPVIFCFIWLSGFRGEDILEIDQPETRIAYMCMAAMFVNGPGRNEQSLERTFHDATTCAFSRGCCEVNGTVVNTVCGGLFKHSFKTNIPLRLETRGSQEPV